MKCDRCGREIPVGESHPHKGQTLCDDCYMDVMLQAQEKECDPWATYLTSREKAGGGLKGIDILDETQKRVAEFVRSKGRATREEVMKESGLSARDLEPHLKVLMHAEIVKERSEGGTMYLIPIPVSQ